MTAPLQPNRTEAAPNSVTIALTRARVDYGFTTGEKDVAALLSLPNKAIAIRLSLQVQTVKNRVTRILRKTMSRNRTECALKMAGVSVPF